MPYRLKCSCIKACKIHLFLLKNIFEEFLFFLQTVTFVTDLFLQQGQETGPQKGPRKLLRPTAGRKLPERPQKLRPRQKRTTNTGAKQGTAAGCGSDAPDRRRRCGSWAKRNRQQAGVGATGVLPYALLFLYTDAVSMMGAIYVYCYICALRASGDCATVRLCDMVIIGNTIVCLIIGNGI